jgi:hypothetical protein
MRENMEETKEKKEEGGSGNNVTSRSWKNATPISAKSDQNLHTD